jgi:hypothetical protein
VTIYTLKASGTHHEERHWTDMRPDVAFRTRAGAENFIPEWRRRITTPDEGGDIIFDSRGLEIFVVEIDLRDE